MIQRSETMPKDADPRSLKSEYKNGLLVLTLQKKKRIVQPPVKQKEKANNKSKPEKTEEKPENNVTKMKVPHTSSHV